MKKLIIAILSMVLTACSSEKTMEERLAEVDQLFAEYEGEIPGAAVMVIQNGEVIMQKGYGMAHFASNSPVTSKSNFRLASVTKQFTAMSILQLIDKVNQSGWYI